VLRAAPDAIVTMDFRNRIVEWNQGAKRLFGYSRAEAIGRYLDDLIAGPDVHEEAAGFTQMAVSGQELPPTETVRHQKDGTPVDVIVAASPILVKGRFAGLVGVYTDITERKREERLQRYAVELQQANEEIKQFAYIVSHDLRAPLVNLADRAQHVMPDGGTLTCRLSDFSRTPDEPPPVPDLPPGRWLVLAVTDTGRGFLPEALPHIFEPFFTTSGVGESLGLGLAQVYGTVMQHEGHIHVVSQVEKGTTFTIYLPAPGQPPAAETDAPGPPGGQGVRSH